MTGHALSGLGEILVRQERFDEARQVLEQAVSVLSGTFPDGHPEVAQARQRLARARQETTRR
jgi:hypothetical protein